MRSCGLACREWPGQCSRPRRWQAPNRDVRRVTTAGDWVLSKSSAHPNDRTLAYSRIHLVRNVDGSGSMCTPVQSTAQDRITATTRRLHRLSQGRHQTWTVATDELLQAHRRCHCACSTVSAKCAMDRQVWMDRFAAHLRQLGAPCKSELLSQIAADRYRRRGHMEPEESASTEHASWPPIRLRVHQTPASVPFR